MIEIDGAHAEGGGSIVRVALALSTIKQKAVHVTNIRANRPQPGLKHQHLFCIKALEELCNAKVEGAELGSTEISYIPGKIVGKTIDVDIQTAGSIPLFLQGVLLPSFFATKLVTWNIIGGTAGKWAAPIEYFANVYLPQLQRYTTLDFKLIKRGYFPKGQGSISLKIHPTSPEDKPPLLLSKRGKPMVIRGISHASMDLQEKQVAERQAHAAELQLKHFDIPINIKTEYHHTASTGSGITLWAACSLEPDELNPNEPIIIGADELGEKNTKAETVGERAAHKLHKELESNAPADSHLADQLIPLMGLLPGSIIKTSQITNHTKTNCDIVERILGTKFAIDQKEGTIRSFNS